MAAPKKYPDELRERAVRLYRESDPKPVIRRLAEQLGVHHEALRNWIRQAEADHGERHDRPTTAETEELRRLRKDPYERVPATSRDLARVGGGVCGSDGLRGRRRRPGSATHHGHPLIPRSGWDP